MMDQSEFDFDEPAATPRLVDARLTVLDLSPDQLAVYDRVLTWLSRPGAILTVGGLAGTGKTTLLGVLAAQLSSLAAFVTYTGRAASVLSRKLRAAGVTTQTETGEGAKHLCSTIHSLLYMPVVDPVTEEIKGWKKRAKLDRPYRLIVVDEASMVSDEILHDIRAHGVPVLAVGDHGQLPPVMASGNLMQDPMLRLEKIHRQAEGSPIISLAHHIRKGGRFSNFPKQTGLAEGVVRFAWKTTLPAVLGAAFKRGPGTDSGLEVGAICWTNRSRVRMNAMVRTMSGLKGPPSKGETLICLKNQTPVYNGMRGVLQRAPRPGSRPWKIALEIAFPDEGIPAANYEACVSQFNRPTTFASVDEIRADGIDARTMGDAGGLFDFGYALTVHKSQGSSFEHAIFFVDRPEDPDSEDWRRFAYTAVTRAAGRLTVVR